MAVELAVVCRPAGIGFTPKSGLSGGVQKGKTEGDYANVGEQSGIIAGSGGYHVTVGDNVDLVGGTIDSTADPLLMTMR